MTQRGTKATIGLTSRQASGSCRRNDLPPPQRRRFNNYRGQSGDRERSASKPSGAVSIPIISHDNRQMRPNEISHLQREFMVRRRDGVNREEARSVLRHKLMWADENPETDLFLKKRYCIVTTSDEITASGPTEVWMRTIENNVPVSELHIRLRSCATASYSDSGSLRESASLETQALTWEPSSISDVNHVCHAIGKMAQAAWNGLLLVPAEQMAVVTSLFHFIKDTRDAHLQRDTVSVRVDSLMCLEDVVLVFRQLKSLEGPSQALATWECDLIARDSSDPCELMSSACNFLHAALLEVLTPQPPPPPLPPRFDGATPSSTFHKHVNPFTQNPFKNQQPCWDTLNDDDTRGNSETATSSDHVRHWLFNCPFDADYEDMTPYSQEYAYKVHGDEVQIPFLPEYENCLPQILGPY